MKIEVGTILENYHTWKSRNVHCNEPQFKVVQWNLSTHYNRWHQNLWKWSLKYDWHKCATLNSHIREELEQCIKENPPPQEKHTN